MLRPRHLAVVALLGMALAACGSDSPEPSASGDATADITVYSGRSEELVGPVIERFEKATGVKVNARYGDTAELATQILDEGGASPADVFFAQDAGALGALQAKGRFARLDDRILSRVAEKYRSSDGAWVGTSGRVRVLAYNPDEVSEDDLPSSVMELTTPAWKGKVGWAPTNGSFQAFVTAFREIEGEGAAKKWLQDMKANDAKPFKDNDSIAEAIAEGEIPVGLVNHYYPFEIKEEIPTANIKAHYFTDGDVGGLINVAGVGILKTSDEQDAAARFIEYLLSDEGQTYFVEETDEYPLVAGIEAPQLRKLEELEAPTIDLNELADLEGTLKLLEDVGLV